LRRTLAALTALLAAIAVLLQAPAAQAHPRNDRRDPVVLVHGYGGSATNFAAVSASLIADGYAPEDIHAFTYDTNQTLRTSAAELNAFVDGVRAGSHSRTVSIVNHSLGGLVTRWYVQKLGGAREVSHVASLAGANHGTELANPCTSSPPFPAACVDMRPGSDLLTALRGNETPGRTRFATWSSPCDAAIVPYTSTHLRGARNHYEPCLTHGQFLTDPEILGEIGAFLAR